MDLELKGKTAAVTGASKGIGLGIAKELIREGTKVAICARNAEETQAEAKLLSESGEVYCEVVDMSQEAQVYAFGQNVVDRFGRINCWVNNVGAQLIKDGEEYTDELMERICAGTLMQRTGRIEECAKPVVFMCGSGSIFMTGVTLEVSGGRFLTLNPD